MKVEPNRARLVVELPASRYRFLSSQGRAPRIGDLVDLDQAYTGPDGLPMVITYFSGPSGHTLYEADVYESELELPT
jgi:hypothetical protein